MKFDSARETETPEKPAAEFELPLEGFTGTPEEKARQRFEQCYRGDTQRQLTLRYIREGELFANMARPSAARAPLSVAAVTACTVLEVDLGTLTTLILDDGRVGVALILEMIARLEEGYAAVSAMAFGSMHERVAGHLLDLAHEAADGRFVVPVTQQQLADHVGTVREVVARVLRDLRRAGILMTAQGRMEICDPRRLAAMSAVRAAWLSRAEHDEAPASASFESVK